jgi:transposase
MKIGDKDKAELLKWLKSRGYSELHRSIAQILLMRERGHRLEAIAYKLNYSTSQVSYYIRMYNIAGIDVVRPKKRGRPPQSGYYQSRFYM